MHLDTFNDNTNLSQFESQRFEQQEMFPGKWKYKSRGILPKISHKKNLITSLTGPLVAHTLKPP